MKNIIIVSKCLRVINSKAGHTFFSFHFRGVFSGEVLRKVILTSTADIPIQENQEYLMYVEFHSCMDGELRGKILKARLLEECWDRS